MPKYHVTLKATLEQGALYWVADVEARDESAALDRAIERFRQDLEETDDWRFTEYDIEPLSPDAPRR